MSKSVAKAPRDGIGREKKRGISTILFRRSGAIGAFATDLDKRRHQGPSPRGGRRLDGDHDEHPDGRMGSRERRPAASTSLDPRARLLEVRARGSSDVLGGYPTISRTAAPAHSAPWTPRRRDLDAPAPKRALRTRECSSNRRSRVRNARLGEEGEARAGPVSPAPLTPRPRQPLRPADV